MRLSLLMALASLACAQVTLRTTTTLVQLSVVAHDAKGRAVTDLTKEDFEIFDNGKQQEIAVFSADKAASPKAAPLSAFPEDAAAQDAKPHGNAVILLDYLNSGLIPAARARGEVESLLKNFDPAGKVALYVLDDNGVRSVGDFGSDREALLSRMASVTGKPSQCNDNMLGSELCDPGEVEYFWMRRELRTLNAFDAFADSLSSLAGRKALIWVSTATNVKAQLARAHLERATPALDAETERVMHKLNNADVALYPVDSCGLGIGCRSHDEAMDEYAARTGGVAVHGLNALDISMRNAIEDIQFTYSLAFYPPQEGARTDFHQLKVQSKRPGVKLEYKQGYSLETPPAPTVPGAELRASAAAALLAKPPELPAPSAPTVDASMQLAYFYTAPSVALVDLAMELKLDHPAQLTIDAVAARPDGGIAARFTDTVKLDAPYRYEHQFRLAPGSYTVRVTFGSGKVEMPLTIDAWDGKHLALSGIALARESRKADPDAISLDGRKALIVRSTEIIPAGSARFQRSAPCLAFFEIYQPAPAKVSLQVRVLDAKTGEQKVDSGVFAVDGSAVSFTVPIATLVPGPYRLEVRATSGESSAVREVTFNVE